MMTPSNLDSMVSKPRFFIVRDDDTPSGTPFIVPLLPLDLLPSWVEVQGYPRELGIHQTGGMTSLGTFRREEEHLQLRFHGAPPADSMTEASLRQDADGSNSAVLDGSHGGENESAPAGHHNATSSTLPQQQSPSTSEPSSLPAAGAGRAPGRRPYPYAPLDLERIRRQYCQAWCHHGICRLGRRCLRRHEMPHTAEALKSIGLSIYPLWWQEKYGCTPPADKNKGEGSNSQQQQQQGVASSKSLPPAPEPAMEGAARSTSSPSLQHLEKGEELDQTIQEGDGKASNPDSHDADLLSFS